MIKFKKAKGVPGTAQSPAAPATPSVQSWMPIQDISNNFVQRRDNKQVATNKILPVNMYLLSEEEQVRKVRSLQEVINGIDSPFQWISIPRPVDLDAYIAKLDDLRQETNDPIQARLLQGYMEQAALMATSGEAVDRQFYWLIDQAPSGNKGLDEQILYKRAHDIAAEATRAELIGHVCNDQELRELHFGFTNASHAGYERAPGSRVSLPPQWLQEWNEAAAAVAPEAKTSAAGPITSVIDTLPNDKGDSSHESD